MEGRSEWIQHLLRSIDHLCGCFRMVQESSGHLCGHDKTANAKALLTSLRGNVDPEQVKLHDSVIR